MGVGKWAATAMVIGLATWTSVSGQQADRRQMAKHGRDNAFVAGEVLIRFKPALSASHRRSILSNLRATRIRHFDALDLDLVRVPPGLALAASIASLRALPGVAFAQPNYFRYAVQSAPPNDAHWLDGSLWGLQKIQAQPVWTRFSRGDGNVVIASLDTGVNYAHPDLAPNMWRNPLEIADNGLDDDGNGYVDDVFGIDTVDGDADPADTDGHGSMTAGIVAAAGNNGVGGVGVNWNAKILACRFLGVDGIGTDAGAIECFDYIVSLRNRGVNIRVSTNSWGALRQGLAPAAALQAAIDAAGGAGIVNVFGAGNDGRNVDGAPFDPAGFGSPSIVSVAASGPADQPSPFSNYGARSIDLAAPGEGILSTHLYGEHARVSGTSAAAAHVAGVAALLSSLDPSLPVAGIKAMILENVDQLPDWTGRVASGGRLNAFRAATALGVGPNRPPEVSIVGPATGGVFTAPADLLIEAAASDGDGSIQRVEFFVNDVLVGSDSTSPFMVPWNGVGPGSYALKAVAVDDMDAATTSAGVAVSVQAPNVPPTIALTSPASGASFAGPATIAIAADAGDTDGSVALVTFYADGAPIGTDAFSPYTLAWTNVPAGTFVLTASATDNSGASAISNAVMVSVAIVQTRLNVALAANGGVASASSTLSANYPASGTINGDRRGLGWGAGGGWNDGTQHATPDWLTIDFNGPKTIDEVSVFSMQDTFSAPLEPTPTMIFTLWGVRGMEIQYWTGTAWATIPGAVVTTNRLVWCRFAFTPVTTSRIRVLINAPLNGYSRVMEVEAWGVAASTFASPQPAADPVARFR